MKKISVQRTPSYDPDVVGASVDLHFQRLGLRDKIKPDAKVLIKPNLIMSRTPDEFTTTHPVVVSAIVRSLQKIGVQDITIADSPGGRYTPAILRNIYEVTGLQHVAEETGAKLNYDAGSALLEYPEGVASKSFDIINPVFDADYIISVPKLKTHCMLTLSGSVKNMFGCVPGLLKPELHYRFPHSDIFGKMLVDINEGIKPDLAIVDAVVSMQGNGPTGGTAVETGLTLASEDFYAMDVALCKITGLDPLSVPTVRAGAERGFAAEIFPEDVEGDFDLFSADFHFKKPDSKPMEFLAQMPPVLTNIIKLMISPKPAIVKRGCIGCNRCGESCPGKAIVIVEKKARIDYSRCLKCYCCHEMCPKKAIAIRRLKLLRR